MGQRQSESSSGPGDVDRGDDSVPPLSGGASGPQVTSAGVTGSSRLYFLDWIRVLALLTVVCYHVFIGGDPFNPTFLPRGIGPFLGIIPGAGIGVFFAVSGAASMSSLGRRTGKQYVLERVLRLALPFVVGCAVLVPIAAWLSPWSGSSDSFWTFYPEYFATSLSSISLLDIPYLLFTLGAWLWVLAFLFAFAMMGLPILRWLRSSAADQVMDFMTRVASHRGGLVLWALPVMALTVIGHFIALAIRIDYSTNEFYAGWSAFLRLFGIFILGAVLMRNRRMFEYVRRDWLISLVAGCVSVGAAVWIFLARQGEPTAVDLVGLQLLEGLFAWSFVLVFLAAGVRWCNRSGKVLAYFLGSILAIYVFHQIAINAVELAFFGQFDLSVPEDERSYPDLYLTYRFLSGLLVLTASFAILLAFIELIVRPIPPLRTFVGVTRERVPIQYSNAADPHPTPTRTDDGDQPNAIPS